MRRVSRPTRHLLLASVSALACVVSACSGSDDSGGTTPLGPPALEIVGFRASDGTSAKADAKSVSLCSDRLLSIQIGPDDNGDGLLDNWFMRPPAACGDVSQCGYVVTTVTSKSGESLSSSSAGSTIPLDLRSLSLVGDYTLRVELHQGKTGKPFLVNKAPVADEVTLSFQTHRCTVIGGGGAGGQSPGSGGLGGMGGALGGAGGSLGGAGGAP